MLSLVERAARNVSIRRRLMLCLFAAASGLVVVPGWGLYSNLSGASAQRAHEERDEQAQKAVDSLRAAVADARLNEAQMLALGTSNSIETGRLRQQWSESVRRIEAGATTVATLLTTEAAVAADAQKIREQAKAYAEVIAPVAQQLEQATMDGAVALAYAGKAADAATAVQAALQRIDALQAQRQKAAGDERARHALLATVLQAVVAGTALVVIVPFMWLTIRSVCVPLEQAVVVADRIAGGDLGEPVPVEGKDEAARVLAALRDMQDSLRRLVAQVQVGAVGIDGASTEIAAGNDDLSARTERAAADLQHTAQSLATIVGAVQQTAASAAYADQVATTATATADRGNASVEQVVATMQEIQASSRRIADITTVIDGIAFQTNILALNAAVEAARAGEQGKGFAVVAAEVRTLAQRSATAAREIKSLIAASLERTESGAKLVGDAGATMREVFTSVQDVRRIVGEISAAAGVQSQGLGAINAAVKGLDEATRENATLVQRSAQATGSFKEQATRLASAVGAFRLPAGEGIAA